MAKEKFVLADTQGLSGTREIPILGHFAGEDLGSLGSNHNAAIVASQALTVTGLVDSAIYEIRSIDTAADGPLRIHPGDGVAAATDYSIGLTVGVAEVFQLKLQEGQTGFSIRNNGAIDAEVSIRRLV